MSNTSAIPILQGRGSSVLRWELDELVLERTGERLTVPARAIARVHAETRSVTIELRALAGATPAAHRIDDVSAAAAVAFADAVNALLPAPAEEVDGGTLVVVHTFARTWVQRFRRGLAWFSLGFLAAVIALSAVLVDDADGPDGPGRIVLGGIFGCLIVLLFWLGMFFGGSLFHERRLRRNGMTVIAVQADRPWTYSYTDSTGTTRLFKHVSAQPWVPASYDPRKPSDVLVPRNPFQRILDHVVTWLSLFGVLILAPLVIWGFVHALRV
ncbi:hypothetical protein [Streptomyces sp. NPDC048603]|uniref:hypothetical protein n=1 Tax=Streptomyces sp. NPDC048603 TaxID=3365577 RepID=UPI003713AC96